LDHKDEPGSTEVNKVNSTDFRNRTLGLSSLLVLVNIAAWIWAYLAFGDQPILLGTAFLAYTFGLRHALDADHIAAIDNVTRKLVQNGDRPVSVGFYFALGHSTVVILAVLIVYWTASIASERFKHWQELGEIVSTCVSACFLFGIALLNLLAMQGTYRLLKRRQREGGPPVETVGVTAGGGIASRLLRPLMKTLARPSHMYPIGFLFGLGFETATEIALLQISASSGAKGQSLANVIVLPVLFTAGMTLIDSADGMIMVGAYNWAFINPVRKLYYNLTITFVSVVVAVVVGGIELAGLLKDHLSTGGGWFWETIDSLNDNFGIIGALIVCVFILIWMASAVISRVRKLGPSE
jgi:nickel/cobalt transporter (NiCoT) family protein